MASRPVPIRDAVVQLGNRLRDVRVSRDWTLQDLSEATEIPVASLSAYELGTRIPSLARLLTLCTAYDLLLVDLLAGLYPFGSDQRPRRLAGPGDARRHRGRSRPTGG